MEACLLLEHDMVNYDNGYPGMSLVEERVCIDGQEKVCDGKCDECIVPDLITISLR